MTPFSNSAIDQLPRFPVADGRQGLLARGVFSQFAHQTLAVPIALYPEARQIVAVTLRAVKGVAGTGEGQEVVGLDPQSVDVSRERVGAGSPAGVGVRIQISYDPVVANAIQDAGRLDIIPVRRWRKA